MRSNGDCDNFVVAGGNALNSMGGVSIPLVHGSCPLHGEQRAVLEEVPMKRISVAFAVFLVLLPALFVSAQETVALPIENREL